MTPEDDLEVKRSSEPIAQGIRGSWSTIHHVEGDLIDLQVGGERIFKIAFRNGRWIVPDLQLALQGLADSLENVSPHEEGCWCIEINWNRLERLHTTDCLKARVALLAAKPFLEKK